MLEIAELKIQLPGMNADEANQLGKDIAEKVAKGMPSNIVNKHIPEIKIQCLNTDQYKGEALTEHITRQIIQQIKLASL